MLKSNLFKAAHKMTREIKAEYANVDYKFQFGLCLAYLLKGEVKMDKIQILKDSLIEVFEKHGRMTDKKLDVLNKIDSSEFADHTNFIEATNAFRVLEVVRTHYNHLDNLLSKFEFNTNESYESLMATPVVEETVRVKVPQWLDNKTNYLFINKEAVLITKETDKAIELNKIVWIPKSQIKIIK